MEGLVLIFKFPLAIMEILEPILVKCNFEEVNDILSNLRTQDDNEFDRQHSLLPNSERIIAKARNIKLSTEELRALKKEYLDLQAEQLKNKTRNVKILPQILEEAEIYEEVKQIKAKALSQQDDDSDEFEQDLSNHDKNQKVQRPNSAEFGRGCISFSKSVRSPSNPLLINVNGTKSIQGFRDFANDSYHESSHLKLPPIVDTKQKGKLNADILKHLNIETSFELQSSHKDSVPQLYKTTLHKSHKSVKYDHPKPEPMLSHRYTTRITFVT